MNDSEVLRKGLAAYDAGVADVWRLLNELVRAGVSDETIRCVIEHHDPGPRARARMASIS